MKKERQRYIRTKRNRRSHRGTGMKKERQRYTRTKRNRQSDRKTVWAQKETRRDILTERQLELRKRDRGSGRKKVRKT